MPLFSQNASAAQLFQQELLEQNKAPLTNHSSFLDAPADTGTLSERTGS